MERNNLGIIVKERPHVRVASKNCLVLQAIADLGILEVSPDGAQEEACGLGLLSQRAAQLEEALDHCPTKEERRTLCREERHGARPSSP